MKAFPISKSFTAVVVLLVALSSWGAEKKEFKSREECIRQSNLEAVAACEGKGENCNVANRKIERESLNDCGEYPPAPDERAEQKEQVTECNTQASDLAKAREKIVEQCGRAKIKNTVECKKKAESCSRGTDIGDLNEGENENIFENIFGINSDGKERPQSEHSCLIQDDDKERTNKERVDDKISKLRSDIASLEEDMAKADDDVAIKRQEVEEKILELEKEMDKKTNERKTEAQKETARMQQEVIEALKRKKSTLRTIEDKNKIIASLRLTQQEEAIKFITSNLMKACRDDALKLKAALIETATKAAATSNQGTAVTGNIKKDVDVFAKQCIELANIARTKALKETQDKISFENSNIKDLQESVKLDDQAAANRQKDLEARTKIADDEQTKAEEKKTKELGQLSQKIADIQALVEKKKITYDKKAKAKEKEIADLFLQLNDKSQRFSKIISDISSSSEAVEKFVGECCDLSESKKSNAAKGQKVARLKYESTCNRLKSDYPEETKSYKVTKPKTKK